MEKSQEVSVIGLGFVGLTLAVFMARKGLRVLGIETNPQTYRQLTSANVHFYETGLNDELKKVLNDGSLSIHPRHPSRINHNSRTFFITVGTPIVNGKIATRSFENAVNELKPYLVDGDTVISRSTTGIGMARKLLLEKLANFPNCKIAVCPERTIEGNALNELQRLPQIIGGDNKSKEDVKTLFNLLEIECIDGGSLEQVEFIKLMTNTYRDIQFAISNEFAMFAEDLGLSFEEIFRISRQGYDRLESLRPQGPSSGPCLSKDPIIMSSSSQEIRGKKLNLALKARATHLEISNFAIERVLGFKRSLSRFGILGLAFKGIPETDDTRDSFSKTLISDLLKLKNTKSIASFDPLGSQIVLEDKRLKLFKDFKDVLNHSECVFITNNHPFFSSPNFLLELEENSPSSGGVIYDFWNNLKDVELKGWKVMKFGGF